jgi:hypothetical protein
MGLFRRLATESASRLGYMYPASLDDQVSQFVTRLYEEDTLLALGGVSAKSE